MDPLSFTASLIAVISVAGVVGRALNSIRTAPSEIKALKTEVFDLQGILKFLDDISTQNWHPSQKPQIDRIKELLLEAQGPLDRLEELLDGKLQRPCGRGVRRRKWAMAVGQVNDIRKSLQETRQRMAVHISTLIASTTRSIGQEVAELRLETQAIIRFYIESRAESVQILGLVKQLRSKTEVGPLNDEMESKLLEPDTIESESAQILSKTALLSTTTFSSQNSRRIANSCSCRQQSDITTPAIFGRLLGQLFVSYSMIPRLSQKCNQHTCRARSQSSILLQYNFPTWIFARVLTIWATAKNNGPEFLIRLPRLREQHDPIFSYIMQGKIDKVQLAFSKGEASILDVNSLGGRSLLHVS